MLLWKGKRLNQRVAVTGANGFIGVHLVANLMAKGHGVRAIVRSDEAARRIPDEAKAHLIADAHDGHCWDEALVDCDVVIHLIGLAHAAARDRRNLMKRFREVNVGITGHVVNACLRNGVRRLIYLSSIKAIGEGASEAYTETSECSPEDPYGISKREAEMLVLERTQGASIEASIVRPPVVYGPGVKGNIARMLKLLDSGLPLPIRCLSARRSMVYVGNLVDALHRLVEVKAPVEGVFLVGDAEDPLTTRELLCEMGRLMGKRVVEIPVPVPVLRGLGRLIGMKEEVDRLTRSLTVSAVRLRDELGWRPPYPRQMGLAETVRWEIDRLAER